MQKMNKADLEGCTVYTTLEPCSIRKLPKTPCTNHLIDGKVKRVVYGVPDKDESVYGHHTLIEAEIEIDVFPDDLVKTLLALNKGWSDSLRVKPIVPPNNTPPLASVSYYKLGTSMADNTHFFVRSPKDAGGFYTVEDAAKNASWLTLEHSMEIAIAWRGNGRQKENRGEAGSSKCGQQRSTSEPYLTYRRERTVSHQTLDEANRWAPM